MSEEIKNKLLDYEVVPPASAWHYIADELEGIDSVAKLHSKLYVHSVAAPANSWEKINAALENELPMTAVSATLWAAEVEPPADTWQKVRNALDETVPAKRRIVPWTRLAAAAVLLFVAIAAVRFLGNNKETHAVATNPIITKQPSSVNPPVEEKTNVAVTEEEEHRNDIALEDSKKTYAKLDLSRKKRLDLAADFRFSSYDEAVTTPDNDEKNNLSDRYIVLMTPEGNFIRVSKKLGDLVCCVSGEEQDPGCRDQVEKWRKQIACSSASHPGNFVDILNLLSSLQED